MNRGKIVIVTILVVGASMASFAWWNRWQRSQKVIEHWGAEAPTTIRLAERVELLRLAPPETEVGPEGYLAVGPQMLRVAQRQEITKVPGLIHAQHMLVQYEAFDWDAPREENCPASWSLALKFVHGEEQATVVLDFPCGRAFLLEREREVGMRPIAGGMQKFLSSIPSADGP